MNKYTYDEVLVATLAYFNGDELKATTWINKYCLTDNDGNYYEKTPKDMHERLSDAFYRIEQRFPNGLSKESIFELLDQFKYVIPQGSPMAGVDNPYRLQSLGNCFVLPSVVDSYSGIIKTDERLANIFKRRGGCGVDISALRPKDLKTSNAAKTTTGIGPFMERFSRTCAEVCMGGRRGALMLTIGSFHPELMTFINIKNDKTKVTAANISIRIDDKFMKAVEEDTEYEQYWPEKNPTFTQKVRARDVWMKIVDSAWSSAEPGVLFWDTIIKNSPPDIYAQKDPKWKTVSTNPCSEIPICSSDSCRLLAINLASFVENPFTNDAYFDFDKFADVTIKSQRLMDDLCELELEHMQKIIDKIKSDPEEDFIKRDELEMWQSYQETCRQGRRTGLGITGLGDCLAFLSITYGSEKSIEITEKIYKELAINAYKSSAILAKERGAFEVYDSKLEKGHTFLSRILNADKELKELHKEYGRRNIAILTTAPTGSVSILTGTTGGIEPAFLLKYDRFRKVNPNDPSIKKIDRTDPDGTTWQKFTVFHDGFKKWMEITGKTSAEQSPYHRSCSDEINWIDSVKIQAVAQKWIDHAISKTCNLPKNATKELVSEVYLEAWRRGCKGFTIFREGSRDPILARSEERTDHRSIPKRPAVLQSETQKMKMEANENVSNSYVTTSFLDDEKKKPYEVFINAPIGQNLKDLQILELSTRLSSLALRHGVPLKYLIEQLKKVDGQFIFSTPTILAKALSKYLPSENRESENKESQLMEQTEQTEQIEEKQDQLSIHRAVCPQCHNDTLIYSEGCSKCISCDFSKCS